MYEQGITHTHTHVLIHMCLCVSFSVFGELSKKLAEVWKAMPEKDKLVSCLFPCLILIRVCFHVGVMKTVMMKDREPVEGLEDRFSVDSGVGVGALDGLKLVMTP